jgi:glycosyltransferase involved in cell wall biosynthesis
MLHYAGPPGIGGVETTIAAHTRLLMDKGYPIRLVVGIGDYPDPNAKLHVLPLLSSRHPQIEVISDELNRGEVSPAFRQLVEQLTTELAAALTDCSVAIVHNVMTLHKNLAFTAALANLHQRGVAPRLIAWAHDFAWAEPHDLPQLHKGWPWSLLREPWPGVFYVTVSEHRRQILANLLGLAVSEITAVPPGVDVTRLFKLEEATQALVERFNLLTADPLLLLPARITRHKNVELALQIVSELRNHMPSPRLVVTGPPDPHNPHNAVHLAELHALRARLEAPVLFLYETFLVTEPGSYAINDAMIADWLSLTDGLLFPSITEGFGIPVIEGALHGTPLFCSDIPSFREIAGDYVLRFGLDEPPATIAERIARVLRDDVRYILRQRIRQHFTWEAIYKHKIQPLLQRALSPVEA